MSDVQITKTFNGWLLEDKDDNLWSYSDSEVDGFIDQLSQLIDLQMVLSSDSPFYGGEMPLQTSPEQPSYKHPEKDIFNLSEDEDGTETMLSDSFPNAAGGVTERKVFKDGSASIKSTDAAGGSVTLKSDPITPMADLSGAAPKILGAADEYICGISGKSLGSAE